MVDVRVSLLAVLSNVSISVYSRTVPPRKPVSSRVHVVMVSVPSDTRYQMPVATRLEEGEPGSLRTARVKSESAVRTLSERFPIVATRRFPAVGAESRVIVIEDADEGGYSPSPGCVHLHGGRHDD